jgi:TPR repeat protein
MLPAFQLFRNSLPIRHAVSVLFVLLLNVMALSVQAIAGDRLALVIGNGNYDKGFGKLEKPGVDADRMAELFRSFGYQVTLNKDIATKADFANVVDTFANSVTAGSEVLIYYSGHGFSGEGASKQMENYFVPTQVSGGGKFDEESKDPQKSGPFKGMKYKDYVFQVSFSQRELEDKINTRKPAIIVYLYDHCRDVVQKGVELEAVSNEAPTATNPSTSTYYIYAAGPNEKALELDLAKKASSKEKKSMIDTLGLDAKLSIFANALVKFIGAGPLDNVAPRIADTVYLWTVRFGDGQRQKPHHFGYIPFRYFLDHRVSRGEGECGEAGKALDELRERSRKRALSAEALEQELAKYESCDEVYSKINEIKRLVGGKGDAGGSSAGMAGLPQGQSQPPEGPVGECDVIASAVNDPARPKYAAGIDLNDLIREALLDDNRAGEVRKALDKAIEVCTRASESNTRLARPKFNLARVYLAKAKLESGDAKGRDLYFATKNYKDAEGLGYVAALNDLGAMNQDGLIVKDLDTLLLNRDPKQGAEYYRRAAELGMVVAQYNTGVVYRDGLLGEKEDKVKAYRYFSRAAESGYVPAMIQTAVALWNGAGISKDTERSMAMLKRAADKGSVRAYYLLGWTYENGKSSGGPEEGDPLRSLIWYTRAAELGDSDAFEKVARLLTEGPGLPDTQRVAAARYWRLAAQSGSIKATLQLARMLLNNEIQIKPGGENEPMLLLKDLTDIGYAAGYAEKAKQYQIGFSFNNKPVFEKDYKKAVEAAEKAISISKAAEEALDARFKEIEQQKKAAEESEKAKRDKKDKDEKKEEKSEAQTKYNPESYRNRLDSENADPRNQYLAAATILQIAKDSPGTVAEDRIQELRKTYGEPEKLTYLPLRCTSGAAVQIFAAWDWSRDDSSLAWQFKWREMPMAWQNTSEQCFVSQECKKRIAEAYKRFKQQKDGADKKSFVSWALGASNQLDAAIETDVKSKRGKLSWGDTCKYFGL